MILKKMKKIKIVNYKDLQALKIWFKILNQNYLLKYRNKYKAQLIKKNKSKVMTLFKLWRVIMSLVQKLIFLKT